MLNAGEDADVDQVPSEIYQHISNYIQSKDDLYKKILCYEVIDM